MSDTVLLADKPAVILTRYSFHRKSGGLVLQQMNYLTVTRKIILRRQSDNRSINTGFLIPAIQDASFRLAIPSEIEFFFLSSHNSEFSGQKGLIEKTTQ